MESTQPSVRARGLAAAGLLSAVALLALGCTISPVVSAPLEENSRYSDCERAADLYCSDAVGATGGDRNKCVAQHTYECVSRSGT